MKSMKRGLRECLCGKVIAYVLVCCLTWNTSLPVAKALGPGDVTGVTGPTGGAVLPAGPGPWVDPTIVTENGAIIDWSNFNTVGGETVTFEQYDVLGGSLSATSAVLNRISSGLVPTQFNGDMIANGRVFVVNPAGIVFGGGTINVAQLVASGLGMTNDAFNNAIASPTNEMVFDDGGTGNIECYGTTINANQIYLVGRKIKNNGSIKAPNGLIVVAAGETVRFAQDGSNVVVEVLTDPLDTTPDIDNRSLLAAYNGTVVLAAGDTFSRAIQNVGFIVASSGSMTARAARIINKQTITVSSSTGDAGSIYLAGREEITFGPDYGGVHSETKADGAAAGTGNGGTITLETEGAITFPEDEYISARGGGVSGDGGHVKIIADDFILADVGNQIDASPQDSTSNPGTLEIESPTVTVAAGVNAGAQDTVYEQDIETLSTNGTNLIIRGTGTNTGVTVENMADPIIGGRGGIEFHASGANGSVSFDDTTDSISTTTGGIAMSAGSGGINVGSLETGQDSANPGSIALSTTNGGNISAQNLAIRNGWGHAEISADASGSLTVSGDVAVGRDVAIQNVADGADAEAIVNFNAGGTVNVGAVTAASHGANATASTGVTRSYISINGGADGVGNVNINGNLVATAISAATGTADATIEVHTPDNVIFAPGVDAPRANGDNGEVEVQSYTSIREEISGDVAEIIISQALLQALPDFGSTHMGSPFTGNVLDNDNDPLGNPLTATLGTGPSHASSFTLNPDGSYSYTPEPGYVGDDTFTYTATADGTTSSPVLVTITMNNNLPTATDQTTTTHMGVLLNNTLQGSISDPDSDPLTTSLVTDVTNGTLTLNPDGTYSYQPSAGYVGPDSFTYSVVDPETGATPAQATVTINMTNTLPALADDVARTTIGTPVTGNVLTNDTDADGDPLTSSLINGPANASAFQLNADGSFSYTPKTGFIGEDSFTYSAGDPQAGTTPGQAMVTITVSKQLSKAPPPAPGVNVIIEPEISGTPALVKWVAEEIGVSERVVDVWFANTLASARDIAPVNSYSRFKKAARILQDSKGIHTSALSQVIDEFASSTAPPTEEQMASIAEAISVSAESDSVYALAGEYVNSLENYVTFLVTEMGFSQEDAVVFVTDKYVDQLAEKESVGLAAYVAARLADIFTDSVD